MTLLWGLFPPIAAAVLESRQSRVECGKTQIHIEDGTRPQLDPPYYNTAASSAADDVCSGGFLNSIDKKGNNNNKLVRNTFLQMYDIFQNVRRAMSLKRIVLIFISLLLLSINIVGNFR